MAISRAFWTPSNGRTSFMSPSPDGIGAMRAIADSPVMPLPRDMRIKTVSA